MSRSRVIGIIPARIGSKRLAGKPLVMINGKPLVQRVYENAAKSKRLDRLMVATDSSKVSDLVFAFGGEAYVSLRSHPTGTDRVAEVVRNLRYDLVVNIQCDLPRFPPALVDLLVSSMLKERSLGMATLATRISDPLKLKNPNVVKVVLDENGFALYFSRYPIPFIRLPQGSSRKVVFSKTDLRRLPFYEHVGIYGYRRDFLMRLSASEQTPLEKLERLEQLRALETGHRIKVYLTQHKPVTLDVPSDLKKLKTRKGRAVR